MPVAVSTAFSTCEYTDSASLPASLPASASSSNAASADFLDFLDFLLDLRDFTASDASGAGAANTGALRLGLPMNILDVTSVPSSRVTVRAKTRKSPSRHRRVSSTRSSSTSTQTSPSHRAVTRIADPSGATISRGLPTSVRFTTAVSPSMAVSSRTPASRSCASECSSLAFTCPGTPVANAEPNASRNPAWLSTAWVSHVPLRVDRRGGKETRAVSAREGEGHAVTPDVGDGRREEITEMQTTSCETGRHLRARVALAVAVARAPEVGTGVEFTPAGIHHRGCHPTSPRTSRCRSEWHGGRGEGPQPSSFLSETRVFNSITRV